MNTTPNLENGLDARTGRSRRLRHLIALFAALFGALIAFAGPAGATTYLSGNHYGGTLCDGWRYLDNAGAESCVNRGAVAPGSWINLQNIAYDYGRDGMSARSAVRIQQNVGGVWYNTNTLTTATSSNGYGWNYVAPEQRLYRWSGASQFRLVLTACTWDKTYNRYGSCATRAQTPTNWV